MTTARVGVVKSLSSVAESRDLILYRDICLCTFYTMVCGCHANVPVEADFNNWLVMRLSLERIAQ
jgi:hypothetical protein